MGDLHPHGSPTAPVWIIIDQPYLKDAEKGFIYSSGYGYVFHSMMKDAGLNNYYICARRPDLDSPSAFSILENYINQYQPPLILPVDEVGKFLIPQMRHKEDDSDEDEEFGKSNISKYVGSLLTSDLINYPHFVLPIYSPDYISSNWAERDIMVSLDLGKAKSELDYFKENSFLQDLPKRELKYELSFEELIYILEERFLNASRLSTDIETIYPKKTSLFWPHPGYPITIGMSDSPDFGISFNLFWDDRNKTVKLWKILAKILKTVPQLGQNFFNFDIYFLESLGFEIVLEEAQDTLIRHHILWPELPHKLQFLTRQYTREPYYKDEGKGWSIKDLKGLRKYNCLDVCVTYEVYLAQEKEFDERPYLR